MNIRGIAVKVLMDKEELCEFRIGNAHHDEPGGSNQQQESHALANVQMPPQRPVPLPQGVDNDSPARKHDADQSLGQYGKACQQPAQQHPVAHLCPGLTPGIERSAVSRGPRP